MNILHVVANAIFNIILRFIIHFAATSFFNNFLFINNDIFGNCLRDAFTFIDDFGNDRLLFDDKEIIDGLILIGRFLINICINNILLFNNLQLLLFQLFLFFQSLLVVFLNYFLLFLFILNFRFLNHVIC